MKGSIIVLLFFVAGCLLGVTEWLPFDMKESNLTLYILYALMLQVGLSIGSSRAETHHSRPETEISAYSSGYRLRHAALLGTCQHTAFTLEHIRLHGSG